MQEAIQQAFDRATAEAFAERVSQKISDGAVTVMLSVGHKLGLLDAFARLGPVTSRDLAQATGLAERYALVVGGHGHGWHRTLPPGERGL
jgi:hypothetical protein